MVFAALDLIVFSHLLQSTDVSLFCLINSNSPLPLLDSVMVLSSLYGREVFWGVLTTAFFVFSGREGRRTAFILAILFMLLSVVGYTLKFLEYRDRPFQVMSIRLLVAPEYDSSFPSGHALISMGGATVTWVRARRRWAVLIGGESSLVAYSRIYVGVHYPLDVLAGSVLGISIACLLLGQTNRLMTVYDKLSVVKWHSSKK